MVTVDNVTGGELVLESGALVPYRRFNLEVRILAETVQDVQALVNSTLDVDEMKCQLGSAVYDAIVEHHDKRNAVVS